MARLIFSREFKVEAVRLVKERGVSVAQACRDLDVHENVLRRWIRELTSGLVTDALIMAIWRRGKPDALLHHSDRASQ
jgi:transposase